MKKFFTWALGLLGNNFKARLLIFVFIGLMILLAYRCHAIEADLSAGASFGCLHGGPVLGLDIRSPFAPGFGWNVGTTLWGSANGVRNNWDWHARVEFARGPFGLGIGPAYLQNVDSVNGAHTEFSLEIFFRPWRLGAELIHLSDAGTSEVNCGRNAVMGSLKMRSSSNIP